MYAKRAIRKAKKKKCINHLCKKKKNLRRSLKSQGLWGHGPHSTLPPPQLNMMSECQQHVQFALVLGTWMPSQDLILLFLCGITSSYGGSLAGDFFFQVQVNKFIKAPRLRIQRMETSQQPNPQEQRREQQNWGGIHYKNT